MRAGGRAGNQLVKLKTQHTGTNVPLSRPIWQTLTRQATAAGRTVARLVRKWFVRAASQATSACGCRVSGPGVWAFNTRLDAGGADAARDAAV